MTQPPYGDQARPADGSQTPYGRSPDYAQQEPHYPQQELLPQQVLPGRSRWPLIVGAVVVLVAVVAALVVWRVAHDDGESNRAAYCQELRRLTSSGGLNGLMDTGGSGGSLVPKAVTDLADLAPGSVQSQWKDLIALAQSASADSPSVAQIARAFTDLQTILADARSECGLDLQFPG